MANQISGMIIAQASRSVNESGRFVKLEAANATVTDGQDLPEQGKELPPQTDAQPASKPELREAVDQINNFVQSVQRNLSFSIDEGSGHTVIRVTDSHSGELVRQIPSEEVLALATYLKDVSDESALSQEIPQGILFSEST